MGVQLCSAADLIRNLDNLGDLYTDDVVRTAVDAVLFRFGQDCDASVVEFFEFPDFEPPSSVIVVLVDDVSGEQVGHTNLHDLYECALHENPSARALQS